MLNRLARYQPVLQLLKKYRPAKIFEIGSGSMGLGEFWRGEFVGVDISFPKPIVAQMTPVQASGAELPFASDSFDMVVSLDVLEHMPPNMRPRLIKEALRVTRSHLILGFPVGSIAKECDIALFDWFKSQGRSGPQWLTEHLQYPFPEAEDIESVLNSGDYTYSRIGNENARLHGNIIRWEVHSNPLLRYSAYALRYYLLPVAKLVLKRIHYPPYYREIFLIHKNDNRDK